MMSHRQETAHDDRAAPKSQRALAIALVLTAAIMAVEFVGGLLFHSLALIADAGHMVTDAAALGLSAVAVWMAQRPHTARRTFGFHRVEVLAAFINGIVLLLFAFYVALEAARRFRDPADVKSGPMLVVAVVGLAVNLLSMSLLGRHRKESLNVRGAFLHVLGDALGSVGAIAAAIVIILTGWAQADPLASILISLLIVVTSIRLMKETAFVLLEHAPADVDVSQVQHDILAVTGVTDVHDLHVWTVTSGFVSLSTHVRIDSADHRDRILHDAVAILRDRHGISHVTLQTESQQLHEDADLCCLNDHQPSRESSEKANVS